MKNPYLSWLQTHDSFMARAVQSLSHDNISRPDEDYIDQLSEINHFKDLLDQSLDTNLSLNGEGYKLDSMPENLGQALKTYPPMFQKSLNVFLGHSSDTIPSVSVESNAAWLIIARALGRYAAQKTPTALCKNLLFPRASGRPPTHYHQEFAASFRTNLIQNSERRNAWIRFFNEYASTCLPDILDEIYGHRERERVAMTSLSETWRSETDPFAIIKSAKFTHSFSYSEKAISFIGLLRDIDTLAWLTAIDRLPFPSIIADEISRTLHGIDDEETIFQLIRDAPPLFIDDKRWSHSCAILLLYRSLVNWLDFIQSRLRFIVLNGEPISKSMPGEGVDLQEEVRALLEKFEEQDALLIMRKACTAALSRSDGKNVLIFFFEHYTNRCAQGLYGKSDSDWAVEREVVKALALTLGEYGLTPQCLEQEWRKREATINRNVALENFALGVYRDSEVEDKIGAGKQLIKTTGIPLLFSAIKLWQYSRKSHSDASRTDVAFLWLWFESILIGYDPGLCILENTHSQTPAFIYCLLADLLAHHEHPVQAWKNSFEKLEPQRIRMCFRSSTFNWSSAGSDVLNFVALTYIKSKLGGYGTKDAGSCHIGELHSCIFDSSWFLYLTATPSIASVRISFLEKLISQIIGIALLPDLNGSIDTMRDMLNRVGDLPNVRCYVKKIVEDLIRKGNISHDVEEQLFFIVQ